MNSWLSKIDTRTSLIISGLTIVLAIGGGYAAWLIFNEDIADLEKRIERLEQSASYYPSASAVIQPQRDECADLATRAALAAEQGKALSVGDPLLKQMAQMGCNERPN